MKQRIRRGGERRWQHSALRTENDPAALYWAAEASRQQMLLWKADPIVAAYQEIHLQGKDNVLCNHLCYAEGLEYKSALRRARHCC